MTFEPSAASLEDRKEENVRKQSGEALMLMQVERRVGSMTEYSTESRAGSRVSSCCCRRPWVPWGVCLPATLPALQGRGLPVFA